MYNTKQTQQRSDMCYTFLNFRKDKSVLIHVSKKKIHVSKNKNFENQGRTFFLKADSFVRAERAAVIFGL